MRVKSFVGNHDINVVVGATFDPSCRKHKGGHVVATIPYSGRMLSAKAKQTPCSPIVIDGVEITITKQEWEAVDPIPSTEECEYCIVSAMYVDACRKLGMDTSRLLTMNGTVVDDNNRIVGTTGFTQNWLNIGVFQVVLGNRNNLPFP